MLTQSQIQNISQETSLFKERKKQLGVYFLSNRNTEPLTAHVISLGKESDLLSPVYFSKNGKGGIWAYYIKKFFNKLSKPFVKFGLIHQQNFNDLTVALADYVLVLEKRIFELEKIAKENCKSRGQSDKSTY